MKFIWILTISLLIPAGNVRAELTQASYYTIKSAKHEGTSGIRTANGERFNENALTCASWQYPFGSLIRVKNPANNRAIVVRVNDRGPSKKLVKKGRAIDLTPRDFSLLGIPPKRGVATVDIERIK